MAHPSARVLLADTTNNDMELRLNLDLLEERKELAAIKEANYKTQLARYYNSRIKYCTYTIGDFVFRSNDASNAEPHGKLAPKWEDPPGLAP